MNRTTIKNKLGSHSLFLKKMQTKHTPNLTGNISIPGYTNDFKFDNSNHSISLKNTFKDNQFSPIHKKQNNYTNIHFQGIKNSNNPSTNFMINIYNAGSLKDEANKSGFLSGLELENIRKNRKESVNSFTLYRNFNQFKKDEFKKIIDDPSFPNISFTGEINPIKGFCAKSFVNYK